MNKNTVENIQIPIDAVIGRATVTLSDLAAFGEGTIFELNCLAGEPVSLIAAGTLVGQGEVVVIDGNFGIRVTKMYK